MTAIIRTVCLIICVTLTSCCMFSTQEPPESALSGSQKASRAAAPAFPKLELWLLENKLAVNAGKSRVMEYEKAFEQGAIVVYGEGYPLAGADGAGQKRLTAMLAAEVVAKRNLAEYFARYATEGEIRFSTYNTRLEAFLKGADVAVGEYNPDLGKAAVLLRLNFGGAKGFGK